MTGRPDRQVAWISGAASGFGAATARLPTDAADDIRESEQPLSDSDGATLVESGDGTTIIRLTSGTWESVSALAQYNQETVVP